MTDSTSRDEVKCEVLTSPKENEYEVWANGCASPPRVLVVVSDGYDGPFKIIDPSNGNEPVFTSKDFVEIVDYLCEDDYERVRGRMAFEACDDDDDW